MSGCSLMQTVPSGSVIRTVRQLLGFSRRLVVCGAEVEQARPAARVLGAGDFARLGVNQRVGAVSQEPALRDLC